MEIKGLKREFVFNGKKLPDPDKKKTPAEVAQFYSVQYPELVNVAIEGPKIANDMQVYTFTHSIGQKG